MAKAKDRAEEELSTGISELYPLTKVPQIENRAEEEPFRITSGWLEIAEQAANAGFYDWDMVAEQLTWSRGIYHLFGLSPNVKPTFDAWLAVVHPEDREPAIARIHQSVADRLPGRNEYRVILPDGQERWINAFGTTFYDEAGKPYRRCGICIDITERKQSEATRNRSVERLAIISDTASRLLMSKEPQSIVEELCRKVMEHLDCHTFFNFLVDDERNCLRLNAYAGIPEETAREIHFLDYGVAVCGCAARDACRIVAQNIPTTPDIRTDLVRSFGITAYACHPLFAQGKVIGTLSFGTKSRLTFGDDELFLMKTVADQVATAMERIRLLRSAQARAEELELRVGERTDELRQALESLSRGRQRLYDVLETLPAYVVLLAPDHRIPFANRVFRDLFGDPADKKCFEHLFGRTEPCETCQTYETLRTSAPQHWMWAGPNGRTYDVRDFPFTDTDGSPLILEMGVDVTDQRRAEEEVRLAYAYNRSLIEANLDPLATISPDGRIADANTATERVTGYSREELIGTDFSDYCTDPEKARAGYLLAFEKGTAKDYELAIRHRDGHVTPVLYNASVYRDETGKVSGVFAAARDMTDQRRLEDELRQSQKMEAIGTLAGGIAHDFNNMLAAILGFTEMVMEDTRDLSDVQRSLQNISKAAIRARDLVKRILTFSRRTEEQRSPISLSPVIRETVQLLRASIPAMIDIELTLTATSDTVLASPVDVQEILMNLVTNASLALSEKGGAIEVSLGDIDFAPDATVQGFEVAPGEYVQLVVRDTGSGMRPDVMKRVFDPFFTTREVGKGTGMGLAVVYGIVQDLQGTVTVESEVGAGSTFRVLLPKIKTRTQEQTEQPAVVPRGNERILFIDDEKMLVEWGRITLERLGYTVTTMTDSREALKAFLAAPTLFDLVITDHSMPQMSGIQLAKEFFAVRKDIPVILCTGYSDSVNAETASAEGINGFLMKPLSKQELAIAIRRALDTRGAV